MTASAFSTSESVSLERQAETDNDLDTSFEQIWSDKHLKVCCGWIKQNNYRNVCLQFPDNYLPFSVRISDSLKSECKTNVFVLADTSYGSCCVDEIAAAHVEADSLIHFGNACRSKVSRLPVLYMFPELPFAIEHFEKHIISLKGQSKPISIYLDIGYHYLLEPVADNVFASINTLLAGTKISIKTYPFDEESNEEHETSDDRICIFIGADNNRFFNLSLTSKAAQWFIYNPKSNSFEEKNPLTAAYIRRRYFYIEKCKDAQMLGLIVATLTSDGYLNVVTRLQEMARSHGIKTQIISVGRINPAKLANFLEIDCFVMIGCPFNNMYTSKEFYKPIVSVFEAEMALNPAWHMKYPESYVTDFKEILPEGSNYLEFKAGDVTENDVSLVSGRMRSSAIGDAEEGSESSTTVAQVAKMHLMETSNGLTFEDRTWKGLDPELGCTEPAKIQKGLSGIPTNYTHD
ncbi:2-(3-amino-3-carboxypropyl)histidine synthase subunit 2 [Eupeodes corollae]|uniref:2-(3-amino-3-carboxypropyl)histidine synthase subunit 2 n=1 Tax=Eupeodes corollae TaxID=290404 RepID=UPI00249165D7|nr:2-(3-amino-3-carboxypropyl)histidine synthase subunit 2 [Eupeodes corollae]